MSYWEDYRQIKLEMTANYIHLMKSSRRFKMSLAHLRISQVLKNLKVNFEREKERRRKQFTFLMIALKFYIRYKLYVVKPLG